MAMHAGGHALGHLGHGFKLQAGASGRHAIGSFGSLFLHSPNDPKGADLAPRRFGSLGHLGHFVIE
jgi:hypothetical protein